MFSSCFCFFLFLLFSFVFFLVGPVFAFETAYIFVFILPVFCLCFPQCFLVVFCFFSFSGFSLLFSSLLVPLSLLKRLICFCFYPSCILPLFFPMFSSCCLFFFLFLLFSFVFFLVGPVFAFETAYIFVFIFPVFCLCIPQCFLVVFCFFFFSCFSLLFSSLLFPFSLLKRHIFLFLCFLYFSFVFPNVF